MCVTWNAVGIRTEARGFGNQENSRDFFQDRVQRSTRPSSSKTLHYNVLVLNCPAPHRSVTFTSFHAYKNPTMPPSRSTGPKSYVYTVTRTDFEHHTDRKGRLSIIEVHASLPSANAAAKAHLLAQSRKSGAFNAEVEETEKDGRYHGHCSTHEDRRDHFRCEVRKMEVKGGRVAVEQQPRLEALQYDCSSDS